MYISDIWSISKSSFSILFISIIIIYSNYKYLVFYEPIQLHEWKRNSRAKLCFNVPSDRSISLLSIWFNFLKLLNKMRIVNIFWENRNTEEYLTAKSNLIMRTKIMSKNSCKKSLRNRLNSAILFGLHRKFWGFYRQPNSSSIKP